MKNRLERALLELRISSADKMLFKTCRRAKAKNNNNDNNNNCIKTIKTENSFGATSPTKVPLPGAFIRAVPFSQCYPLSLILELLSLLCMAIVKTRAKNLVESASKNEKTSDGVDSEGKYERWRLPGTGIQGTRIQSQFITYISKLLYMVRWISIDN